MTDWKSMSRRALLESAVLVPGILVLGILGAGPVAAGKEIAEKNKIKQTDAHYQNQPKGLQRCEICLQFNAPNKCKIVQGPINPKGWCQYFAAKENAH